ncbi:MAG: phage protein Gp37 [Nitrospirota bacterium]
MRIEDLEDKLIETVKTAMPYLRYVDTYQGELDETNIVQFVKNFPAVLIYMEESRYLNRAWPLKWQSVEITILVCDRNLRGNKSARRGDRSNPGTYGMLQDLFDTLFGKDLGLAMDALDILSETALINTSKLAVYAARYKTKFAKN